MRKQFLIGIALVFAFAAPSKAFNLIADVDLMTKWDLGKVAAAGTSINLRNGQYDASEFAEIADYRMLSVWYGGIEVPQSNGNVKLMDAGKLGLNLDYFLKDFVNQPPELIKNLIFGPAISGNFVSTPHVINYWMDVNYRFSGT